MCQICIDWQKGLLTRAEAWRNMSEVDPDHMKEVIEMVEGITQEVVEHDTKH